jgi:hypothetical protein
MCREGGGFKVSRVLISMCITVKLTAMAEVEAVGSVAT